MTVQQFADEAAKRLCDRCSYGDSAYRQEYSDGYEWQHGVDWRGEIYICPTPCDAAVIHQMLRELDEANNG